MSEDREATSRLWRLGALVRMRLGAAILGGGWLGVMMRQRLIALRARECITPDGHVILAKCGPLADALYADISGEWTLSVTRTRERPERAPAIAVESSRSSPDVDSARTQL